MLEVWAAHGWSEHAHPPRVREWLLVEWPERDTGHRLRFDLTLHLSHRDKGRGLAVEPHTPLGEAVARAALGETA